MFISQQSKKGGGEAQRRNKRKPSFAQPRNIPSRQKEQEARPKARQSPPSPENTPGAKEPRQSKHYIQKKRKKEKTSLPRETQHQVECRNLLPTFPGQ